MATLEMNINQVNADFKNIKEHIVSHSVEVPDGTRTSELGAKIDNVFEAGVESGKQVEKSDWWDKFQLNGTRMRYNSAFMIFIPELFYPKYNMNPVASASDMFRQFGYKNGKINTEDCFDLAQRLEDCKVTLNTSDATFLNYIFYDTCFTRIPVIDSSGNNETLSNCFANNRYLVTIDEFVLKDDGSQTFTNTLNNCPELVTIKITGTIGQNGFNVSASTKMSKASITSIVNALSTTTSGLSITLSLTAVNNAFEGGSTGTEWTTLAGTRSNWTINLL